MKQFFLTLLFLLTLFSSNAQEKRALLIGIGDYPTECGWNKIHGQNDVTIIRNTLLIQGFSTHNIHTLIDSEATYDNILKEMQSLLEFAKKDDIIYIQFSGHGQRITDIDGDETDRLDEAWVPYDAHKIYCKGIYEGEKHITDDYLNAYLTKLRLKVGNTGKIIVIADACHSGSGSRGMKQSDEVYKRGSNDTFVIPQSTANIVRKEEPVDWLFVAACKSYQTNYEYKDDHGNYYGSLSYSISKSENQLAEVKYETAIAVWAQTMREITIYPQDLDNEGRPSKKNNSLF